MEMLDALRQRFEYEERERWKAAVDWITEQSVVAHSTLQEGDLEGGVEELRRIKIRLDNMFGYESLRLAVFARDEYSCRYCGHTPNVDLIAFSHEARPPYDEERKDKLTLDHLMPRSRGGVDEIWNLVTACQSCNSKKHNRTPAEAGMVLL